MDAFRRFESAVGHDVNNLTKQNVLNRSRIYAWERVFLESRLKFLKAILIGLWSPALLRERLNIAQSLEVESFNTEMERRFGETNAKKIKII